MYLKRRDMKIDDFETGFKDGIKFINFLEIISG